jgi:LysR family hydrogen peroxide-inducible transcriptional activator
LWLLQEGHCLRAQVLKICELSSQYPKRDLNFEFESGSMGSLLQFTKASKGITIVPYLASFDFSKKDRKNLVEFSIPTPVRSVGLLTHKFFVKKQLLKVLGAIIRAEVKNLIPETESLTVLKPN